MSEGKGVRINYPDKPGVETGTQLFARQGDAGLAAKPHPGKPPRLTAAQRRRRAVLLQRGARRNGCATELWTLRRVAERRLNILHHVRQIVTLAEIYGAEATARAIEDALEFQAFSGEYIANLLAQRQRILPEPGALHLTRRQDLLAPLV